MIENIEDPTKVYVVMICDRHTNPEPYVFADADAAIKYARAIAHEYAHDPGDVKESPIDGWLYYARYSAEDSIWVLEKTVNAALADREASHGE